jgi:hypothetical protein
MGGLVDQHPTSLGLWPLLTEYVSRVIISDDVNHRTLTRAMTRTMNGSTQPDTPNTPK